MRTVIYYYELNNNVYAHIEGLGYRLPRYAYNVMKVKKDLNRLDNLAEVITNLKFLMDDRDDAVRWRNHVLCCKKGAAITNLKKSNKKGKK